LDSDSSAIRATNKINLAAYDVTYG
jgi:hypothetical protein